MNKVLPANCHDSNLHIVVKLRNSSIWSEHSFVWFEKEIDEEKKEVEEKDEDYFVVLFWFQECQWYVRLQLSALSPWVHK